MTNTKRKITLFICLVLSLVMLFVLSSCDNAKIPSSDSPGNTESTESKAESETNNSGSNTSTDSSSKVDESIDESKDDTNESNDKANEGADEEPKPEPEPEVKKYNVTFNSNGGNKVESQLVEKGSSIKKPSSPTKAGYTFDGWYLDDEKWLFLTHVVSVDIELTAKWIPNNNTLVFNSNTGVGEMSEMTIATDSKANLSANEFTKAGYTFKGWATTRDGAVEYTDGAEYTMGTDASYTLYAVWEANNNTLVFNANGGKGTMTSLELASGAQGTLPNNIFTKDGYTFKGWSTTANSNVEYTDGASYTMGTNSSYTLYAVWKANKNTLVFDANGGSGSMSNMTIATDSRAKLTSNAFTRNGYTFKGWATTSNGSVSYADEASYTMGTNSSYTLYAVWETVDYSITYVLNGGTNNSQNLSSYNVEKAFTLKDATKTGYTFAGWYSDSTFNNKVTEIALGTTENKTFYAKWTANENTLVFNANGGSGSMSNMTITTGASKALTTNTFTKAGYTFKGWATTKDGAVEYTDGAEYTMGTDASYTLYAVWETVTYTIKYNFNGGSESISNPTTFTIEDLPIALNDLKNKSDYLFDYWYLESDFSGSPITHIANIGDIELFASYVNGTDGLVFEESDGQLTVSAYNGSSANVIIPSQYKSKNITVIGDSAFYNCLLITDVIIPDSVTVIGELAFCGCDSLTNVLIGNNVTSIGQQAFYSCDTLSTIVIPNSVTSIGEMAFDICSSLTNITIPNSVTSIGGYAFASCPQLNYNEYDNALYLGNNENPYVILVKAKNEEITSCNINEKTRFINSCAFYDCTQLTSVSIPGAILSMEEKAFYNCSSLANVNFVGTEEQWCKIIFSTHYSNPLYYSRKLYINEELVTSFVIPSTITKINDYAFYRCTNLTSITIPTSVSAVGKSAFYNCSSLESVNYLGAVENWCAIQFSNEYSNPLQYAGNLYINKALVTNLTFPNSVEEIMPYSFYGFDALKSVIFGDDIVAIGEYAFYDCSSLESVTIGEGVVTIKKYAFSSCDALLNVSLGNSVHSIEERAFSSCDSLTAIVIPASVDSIGKYAFHGSLTSVTFENPSGWIYQQWYDGEYRNMIIQESVLSNELSAAEYLTSTYCQYHWKLEI